MNDIATFAPAATSVDSTSNLRVTKLMLSSTGTYGQHYRRPYITESNKETIDLLAERVQNQAHITPGLLSGLAYQLVKPQAAPETGIQIPNGWESWRGRFMMEVEVNSRLGTVTTMVILGHTDSYGVSESGAVDPNMVFTINSVTQMRQARVNTAFGSQVQNQIFDSSHVLASTIPWQGVFGQEVEERMRPQDVYTAMQQSFLNTDNVRNACLANTSTPVKARTSYNAATGYASSILENFKNAAIASEVGQSAMDVYSLAAGHAADPSVSRDRFMKAISDLTGMPVSNTFTYQTLLRLDPGVDSIKQVARYSEARLESQKQHNAGTGQTNNWNGANIETQYASILAHAVPAMMMDVGLIFVSFETTNTNFGGAITTMINHAAPFNRGQDISQNLRAFVARLETELVNDLTYAGQMSFTLQMKCNLMGETWIGLSINGAAMEPFATLSVADAMTSPLITNQHQRPMTVARDFEWAMGQLGFTPSTETGFSFNDDFSMSAGEETNFISNFSGF